MRLRSLSLFFAIALLGASTACSSSENGEEQSTTDAGTGPGTDAGSNPGDGGTDQTSSRLKPPADLTANPEPEPTEEGIVIGEEVTKIIGSAGGAISYGEGGPTIDIPAGALAADTEISIRPVSSFAPHKVGASFRFLPHGTQFAKPVSVTFTIPEELDEGLAAGLGVAFRDDEGYWQAVSDVSVDVSSREVVARIDHFSDWTLFQQTELRPGTSSVEVNKSLGLWVYQCTREMDPDTLITPLLPTCKAASGFGNWSVNGIPSGDSTVGTTVPLIYGAAFTAPAKKPAANPVAVSVEVPIGKRKGILVAHVRIVDDGPCTFENPCNWSGESWFKHAWGMEHGRAQVRWVLDESFRSDDTLRYKPEGRVWFFNEEDGCQPPEQPIDIAGRSGRTNELYIDYSGPTPKITVTDTLVYLPDVTLICPNGYTIDGLDTYLADIREAELSEDGTAFAGTYEDEYVGFSSGYRFVRE